jgi:hypothetical protein
VPLACCKLRVPSDDPLPRRYGVVSAAGTALARPPPNPDPKLSPWFESLRQPDTGASCCSISDCRPADYRIAGDHYEAFLEGKWVPVPQQKVLHRLDNPTGHAVVCWTPAVGIM